MNRILSKCRYFFTSSPQINQMVQQTAFSVFQSGKASVSISQHIVYPQLCSIQSFSNYYIHHNLCSKINTKIHGVSVNPQRSTNAVQLNKVFRVIIQAGIGKKFIQLDINSLRKNKIIDDLIILKQKNKYAAKSSHIVIDDQVKDDTQEKALQNNMIEVSKLLETGCNLEVAYMISNKNVINSSYIKAITRRSKSINSNIIEKLGHNTEGHKSLQNYLFHNGFRVQHLFLKSYFDGKEVKSLKQGNNFNLQQLVNVLSIIDFQGKVILQNDQAFNENVLILQQALKKGGFLKKKLGDSDGPMWYLFL